MLAQKIDMPAQQGRVMSKSNNVYDYIIEGLVFARYAFGERLLVKELSKDTGASRQPIMSALNRLSAEGFVHIIPQVGCEVIHPSPTEIADFFLLFQRQEGLLAELAASRRTEDELLELNHIQQRLLAVTNADNPSPEKYLTLNQTFHHKIHLMAHSPLLDRKQRKNFHMIDFFINHSIGFDKLMLGVVEEHNPIIDAITDQDPERARVESENHITAVAKAVLDNLEK